jgi:DNA-binding MarR family transcriptional regulator
MDYLYPEGTEMSREAGRQDSTAAALFLGMREVLASLNTFNQSVGRPLGLNAVEFLCLDLVSRHEPITPGHLADLCGLRPATVTGVLDRLESDGWVKRERDAKDRRRVFVHALRERAPELGHRLGGMRRALREISEAYTEEQLALIMGFLNKAADAARAQAAALRSADESTSHESG